MLVSDQAVKLTLFLLLAESVLCQEKWSRDPGELHKSGPGKSVLKRVEGSRNSVDNRDLKNDECCKGSNSDKASITRLSKEFNKVKLIEKDKTVEKLNKHDKVVTDENSRNVNPILSMAPEPFNVTNLLAKPSFRNDIGPAENSVDIYEDLHSSKRKLNMRLFDITYEENTEGFEKIHIRKKKIRKQKYKEKSDSNKNPVKVRRDTANDALTTDLLEPLIESKLDTDPGDNISDDFTFEENNENIKDNATFQENNVINKSNVTKSNFSSLWNDYVLDLDDNSILEDVDHRIIGGQLISIADVPYLTAILRLHREICGGTLITLSHVLTAAHCITVKGRKEIRYIVLRPDVYSIRYGSNSTQQGGHIIPAGRFYVHPDYLSRTDVHVYMDLAIIWFASSIDETMAAVAKLPTSQPNNRRFDSMLEQGEECVVAGWGMTKKPDRLKRSLLVGTKLKLVDYEKCNNTYAKHGYAVSKIAHICTYSEGTDACHGDSGGGLYCRDRVWGVTSWGIGCAEKGIPGVFARVDTNLDFIKSVIYSEVQLTNRMGSESLSPVQLDGLLINVTCLLFYLIKSLNLFLI